MPAPGWLRLAIVDGDQSFAGRVAAAAELAGISDVELFPAPPSRLKAEKLDAILIDPTAIGDSEFWVYLEETCRHLPRLSVLVCAGQSELAARVRALRLGADDWITKPSDAREILARIQASRRPLWVRCPALEKPVFAGELEMRPGEVDARVAGEPVGLTPREFELLEFFVVERGRVLGRETIYRHVWSCTGGVADRSVYTYIRKLRVKLGAASPCWNYIHTHLRIGYRFDPRRVEPTAAHRRCSGGE